MPSSIPSHDILQFNLQVRPRYRWAPRCGICAGWTRTLRAIIDRIGPCRLEPKPDRFGTLVRAIISQQISSKAAASIHKRLLELGGEPHQPRRLIELGEATLRTVGLSGAKARYVLNLAEAVASGRSRSTRSTTPGTTRHHRSPDSRSRGSASGRPRCS